MLIDQNIETPKYITTEKEMETSQIIKAILREDLPASRIASRDTQFYFGILLDDNNTKPLCRLYFNSVIKYIELLNNGIVNEEKNV